MEQQLSLWDFIPECEDGRKASSHLYFNEDANQWNVIGGYPVSRPVQMDIFELLGTTDQELLKMSDLVYTSLEEDLKFFDLADESTRHFLSFKHGWCYRVNELSFNRHIPHCIEDCILEMEMGKMRNQSKKKEPQNSFFHHESVYLKGLNKMFERRSGRYGKR